MDRPSLIVEGLFRTRLMLIVPRVKYSRVAWYTIQYIHRVSEKLAPDLGLSEKLPPSRTGTSIKTKNRKPLFGRTSSSLGCKQVQKGVIWRS